MVEAMGSREGFPGFPLLWDQTSQSEGDLGYPIPFHVAAHLVAYFFFHCLGNVGTVSERRGKWDPGNRRRS